MKLTEIVVDPAVNVRAGLDHATVEHYREVLDSCPPVTVFETDKGPLLADGFHRVEAARRERRDSIAVESRAGTRADAVTFAAGANLRHGKPLTKAERVEAVRRVKNAHPDWGKKRVAAALSLPVTTVGRYLRELEDRGPVDPLYQGKVDEGSALVAQIKAHDRDSAEFFGMALHTLGPDGFRKFVTDAGADPLGRVPPGRGDRLPRSPGDQSDPPHRKRRSRGARLKNPAAHMLHAETKLQEPGDGNTP